ncbi:hypothetical protein BO99DRAFT_418358 [Aspergillus violaceofuscus CBS 115571]|uniref:CENP-V/GFA domain-containing protein n=1 Tax=Aspergillus violaceofuscus (strain CBS 115571) TaxID=1450538 RepID=A0A2V5HJZ8_ASPV1|nr:hypothetical protein BO99DRAFT_418358 [Aspergillus violaceofuscus CBS 115571]
MPYDGHCMCGRIQVSLPQQPSQSLRCHCLGSSINYVLGDSDVTIKDSRLSLKSYGDYHTQSGNIVLRQFCSECGSPISTKSPDFPGKTLLKASLFDEISRPSQEVFTCRRQTWEPAIEGAKQD